MGYLCYAIEGKEEEMKIKNIHVVQKTLMSFLKNYSYYLLRERLALKLN